MTPQELKNSILQLAIQGKLVEQRPEEGSAEDLYRQIQEEKQRLIKEGKIKRQKFLPEIMGDAKPFDIPENWRWVRLGELLHVISGVSYEKNDVSATGLRILRGGNILNGKVVIEENDVFLPLEYDNQEKRIRQGDIIVVASTGSKSVIGKAGYIEDELPNTMIGAFLRICRPYLQNTTNYLHYIFETNYYRKHIRELAQGTNINNVKESYITEFIIPLPSLAEQRRIVAKIEQLLPHIDHYEQAWSLLEDFNKRFPDVMKKSILQLAIQGKLVEQRPEEGTAEELYQQIQAEKQRLIKSREIKKEKPLPEITEDEMPFDIPGSWKWVRVFDLAFLKSGNQYPENKNGSLYVKVADMNLPENQTEIVVSSRRAEIPKSDLIPKNSIIFPKRGGAIATNKKRLVLQEEIGTDSNIMSMTLFYEKVLPYFSKWFSSIDLGKLSTGTSVPQINNKDIYPLLIPLPPLAEQKRIVAKLEELLPLCERLK